MKNKHLGLVSQELLLLFFFFGPLKTANSISVSLLGGTLIKEIQQLFFTENNVICFHLYLR